jgi:UDP-glucose 4-epimerase
MTPAHRRAGQGDGHERSTCVTGGAGPYDRLGLHVKNCSTRGGHQVTVYPPDNLTEGHRSAVDARAKFIFTANPEGQEGDILNAVKSAQPDAIMHFAASALVGESMTNPKKYFHNNAVNALKLADAAVECGVKKFVFSSTCATYGPPDRMPMTEDLPQRPINPYGESKLMFEKALIWYQRFTAWSSSRSAISTPPARAKNSANITASRRTFDSECAAVALGQKPQCEIYGTDYPTPDGTCIRDYIHIKDLAQAHILGLQPGKTGFTIWATATAIPCVKSFRCAKKSRAKKFPAWKNRAVPATRPGSWPPPKSDS